MAIINQNGEVADESLVRYLNALSANQQGTLKAATDANGNTIGIVGSTEKITPIHNSTASSRPKLLCFGNSIAGQNCRSVAAPTTQCVAVGVRAGATQLTLITGGIAALGLVANDYIGIQLKDQSVFVVQVTVIVGELLTLANRIPSYLRDTGAGVSKVTSPTFWVASQRLGLGFLNIANALLGAPCHILQGYGYGSGFAQAILNDLPYALNHWKPNYVYFIMLENDVAGSSSYLDLVSAINFAANTCLSAGAIPIFESCLPSNSFTAGARATVFDQINAYLSTIGTSIMGAVSINHGTLYIDPAQPTLRTPLASWTDGIHPVPAYRLAIAKYKLNELEAIIGRKDRKFGLFGINPSLIGSSGTKVGSGTFLGASVAPNNTTLTCLGAGVQATTLKNDNDELTVDFNIVGASDLSATQFQITQTIVSSAQTVTLSPSTLIKGIVRIRVTDMRHISMPSLTIAWGVISGDVRGDGDFTKITYLSNELLVLETQSMPVKDPSATSITLALNFRPETLVDGSVVHFSGVIEEFGYEVTNCSDIEYVY